MQLYTGFVVWRASNMWPGKACVAAYSWQALRTGAMLTRGSPAFDAALGDVSAERAALPEVLAEQSLPGERLALLALQGR